MTVSGKVRMARLTDLAALGELSRLAQTDEARSLGLPTILTPEMVFSCRTQSSMRACSCAATAGRPRLFR